MKTDLWIVVRKSVSLLCCKTMPTAQMLDWSWPPSWSLTFGNTYLMLRQHKYNLSLLLGLSIPNISSKTDYFRPHFIPLLSVHQELVFFYFVLFHSAGMLCFNICCDFLILLTYFHSRIAFATGSGLCLCIGMCISIQHTIIKPCET